MKTNTVLTAFGNAKIRPEGKVKLPVINPHTSETRMLDFYVTRSSDIAILGCKACIELDLVRRVSVDIVAENDVLTEEKMHAQYSDVFTGLGEYEKEYHIEVDSNVKPVIQRCRKVPYARYDKLKHTLVDLEKRGVIASVDRPTEWVLGLERIHQVTNTIRIANTGWRIRICIREYSDSLYSLAHSTNRMRGRVKKKWRTFIREIHVGYIIHNNTETPIKTCNVSIAWEPPLKRYNDMTTPIIEKNELL